MNQLDPTVNMPLSPNVLRFAHHLGNSFAELPDSFYTRLDPEGLPDPYLVAVSAPAASLLGLTAADFTDSFLIDVFAGNRSLPGATPLAAVYSGHQFGNWAGRLGDGRAHLLGELPTTHGPLEIQLKGAGLTPYSRMGDGRAVLRSSIREFLCSEAMAALGIPTSRALCLIGSDLPVQRETRETAAVLTRLAPSFVRFGTFEHWFYANRSEELKILANYVIARYYPALAQEAAPYLALLREVVKRTAHLVAQWQAVGFMHGVMNTDNMSILGITLDYGPFGFMDGFDPNHICNHSDDSGRYAYHRQPQVAHWNCFALGQALLPLIGDVEAAQSALGIFQNEFQSELDALLHTKLGLQGVLAGDSQLIDDLFALMEKNRTDFTIFFRRLADLALNAESSDADESLRDLFVDRLAFDAWAAQYRKRLQVENSQDAMRQITMRAANPKYILRNYLLQTAIEKAQRKDFSEIDALLTLLKNPFDDQPGMEAYAALPPTWANDLTVSCSS